MKKKENMNLTRKESWSRGNQLDRGTKSLPSPPLLVIITFTATLVTKCFYLLLVVLNLAPAKVKEVVVETPNTAGGVYIPPSMRNKTASSAGGSSSAGSRSKSGWGKTHVVTIIAFLDTELI